MKKQKIILGIILILILLLTIIFINFKSRKSYTLKIPDINKIVSVSLEKNNKNKFISDKKRINEIYDICKSVPKTYQKSDKDKPTNLEKVKITFYYETSVAAVFYIYKEDTYFLEEPYKGIYEFAEKNYRKITNYLD